VAQLDDDADPAAVTDVRTLNDEAIASMCFHGVLRIGRSVSSGSLSVSVAASPFCFTRT